MKKLIFMFILSLISICATAPAYPVDIQKLYEEWNNRIFIRQIYDQDFSAENLQRLIKILCKHPDIVYAQARLESGEFKSRLFLDYNNLFGMKVPGVRPTTAIGWAMGHAAYKHWSESVYDYMLYQQYYEHWLKIDFNHIDYFYFLKMYGYAGDPYYIKKLKIKLENNYELDN